MRDQIRDLLPAARDVQEFGEDRDAWLRWRASAPVAYAIGGSDVQHALGYRGDPERWVCERRDGAPTRRDLALCEVGHQIEPIVVRRVAEVLAAEDGACHVHRGVCGEGPEPWMRFSLDAVYVTPRRVIVGENKAVFRGRAWLWGVPPDLDQAEQGAVAQVLWYAACTGLDALLISSAMLPTYDESELPASVGLLCELRLFEASVGAGTRAAIGQLVEGMRWRRQHWLIDGEPVHARACTEEPPPPRPRKGERQADSEERELMQLALRIKAEMDAADASLCEVEDALDERMGDVKRLRAPRLLAFRCGRRVVVRGTTRE